MSRWFRVDDAMVDDPKVQQLPDTLFKAVINLWCLTSQNDGVLPPVGEIAFKLRTTPVKVNHLIADLKARELIDELPDGQLAPHNWQRRQYKSDVSTERVQQFRKRSRNVSSDVSETPPETETETERKEDTASAVPTDRYAFESGTIRLSSADLAKWKKAFGNLDVEAELIGLTQWAGEQGSRWFFAVSGALAKRNRDVGLRKIASQNGGALTPSGNPWPEGIT